MNGYVNLIAFIAILLFSGCGEKIKKYDIVLEDSTYIADVRKITNPIWLSSGRGVIVPEGTHLIVEKDNSYYSIFLKWSESSVDVHVSHLNLDSEKLRKVSEKSISVHLEELSGLAMKPVFFEGVKIVDINNVNTLYMNRDSKHAWFETDPDGLDSSIVKEILHRERLIED